MKQKNTLTKYENPKVFTHHVPKCPGSSNLMGEVIRASWIEAQKAVVFFVVNLLALFFFGDFLDVFFFYTLLLGILWEYVLLGFWKAIPSHGFPWFSC